MHLQFNPVRGGIAGGGLGVKREKLASAHWRGESSIAEELKADACRTLHNELTLDSFIKDLERSVWHGPAKAEEFFTSGLQRNRLRGGRGCIG